MGHLPGLPRRAAVRASAQSAALLGTMAGGAGEARADRTGVARGVMGSELLAGKGIEYPPTSQVNRTFPTAPRAKPPKPEPVKLPLFLDRAGAADTVPNTGTK